MDQKPSRLPASYRDPSGFVFRHNAIYYRQVNKVYTDDYNMLMEKLYPALLSKKFILPHQETDLDVEKSNEWYKFLLPEQIPFISYPCEWSFDMLKDAALLTLDIQKTAMENSMTLKDATPYNVQWLNGRMVFIDTLSFEKYNPEQPWIAYRQFCENFLAPLALMHYTRKPLQPLLAGYPEGIPLPVTSALLPFRSKLKMHLYLHLHLHGNYAGKKSAKPAGRFSQNKLRNIVDSLYSAINALNLEEKTLWGDYYEEANTRANYIANKAEVIATWADQLPDIKTVLDLGGNDGTFSKILAQTGKRVVCADLDHSAINKLYKDQKAPYVHPLIVDFSQPTPASGFNSSERRSFHQRAGSDLVMALALIHHLCIGKNIPFADVARSLAVLSPLLVIEFVPKEDPKVQQMLENKKDIYSDYSQQQFENAFSKYYFIERSLPLAASERILYLMKRKAVTDQEQL